MKKRILGILLSLALVIGMMPALGLTAYATDGAEEPTKVKTAEQFRNAVDSGGLVLVDGDINLPNSEFIIASDTTIDLNGHTISNNNSNGIRVHAGGKVTIKDGSTGGKISTTNQIHIVGYSSLTLESGALEFTDSSSHGINIFYGKFTMTGGMIDSKGSSICHEEPNKESINVNITGGTINGNIDNSVSTDEVAITGGRFSFDPTDYLSEGSIATKNGEYWEVSQTPVSYMDWDGTTLVEKKGNDACRNYEVVTARTTTFEDNKWYVVNGTVTNDNRINVNGTAHLILCDGKKLTVNKGVNLESGNSLSIYGQSAGTGQLNATGGQSYAGIGGTNLDNGGTVTINGGTVNATGGEKAAGIGGGYNGDGGTVTINGGTINATGGEKAAGIGGGYNGDGGTVTINSGNVTTGSNGGKGIGGGEPFSTAEIKNGTLTVSDDMAVYGGNSENPTDVIEKANDDYARFPYMKVSPKAYDLWVGGTRVTKANATSSSHPTWSYDTENKILTLNKYTNDGSDVYMFGDDYSAVIYAKQDLTINLVETSSITNKSTYHGCGVYIDSDDAGAGNLTITGEGKLDSSGNEFCGIFAKKKVTINKGCITANRNFGGIYGRAGITINDGSVEASSNKYGIDDDHDVTIKGGNVEAKNNEHSGISGNDVTITGGIVDADATGSDGVAIFSEKGDVSISGGTVTAEGGLKAIDVSTEGRSINIGDGMIIKAGENEEKAAAVDKYNGQKWARIAEVVTRNVVFKVVNGKWNDNSTSDKTETLRGFSGETLKLTGNQIPAVGSNPSNGYKAGAWDVTPNTETAITDDVTYTYTYAKEDKPTPPTPSGGGDKTSGSTDISVGSVHTVNRSKYLVKSATAVYLKKAANGKTFKVPATVKIKGKTFKVTGIQKNAFKSTKVKTLTVKSKKLTKKSVKGSLKDSKIKTVKVKVGNKKINKQYVKKYKKIFTKKNVGRKVTVK